MPKMIKLTEEQVLSAEKEEKNTKAETKATGGIRTIRYYSNRNIPGSLETLFSVAVESVIVVPLSYLDLVIGTLRGENPNKTRYAYKTHPRTNDVVIGVQYAIPQ